MSAKRYYYISLGVNLFCWANLVKNIYRFRIFRTCFWALPTFLSHLALSGLKEHSNQFVTKIELFDDGKRAEVTYLIGKTVIMNLNEFKSATKDEFIGNVDKFGPIGTELFPIMIKDRTVMIDKRGRIEHEDVFRALCNGYTIDLSVMQDSKGRADIIDI